MKTQEKRQKAKVGVAGSFFNQLMSNNSSIPEVGKGATEMLYSDRHCYEVIEVSKDGKRVKLEVLSAEHDRSKPGGNGHQNWILKPTGCFKTVVWRHNAWRLEQDTVIYTKAFKEACGENAMLARMLTEEQHKAVYFSEKTQSMEVWPQNVVEGITERKKIYHKVNILFGTKEYYYDWSM